MEEQTSQRVTMSMNFDVPYLQGTHRNVLLSVCEIKGCVEF